MTPSPPPPDALAPVRRHVLTRLLASWRGHRTRAWVAQEARRLALPARALERARRSDLRRLLTFAAATVPFWAERLGAAGLPGGRLRRLEDLARVPPLTRAEVAEHAERLLSSAWRGRPLVDIATGGTTSAPVPFPQAPRAVWRKDAAALALRRRIGWEPGMRFAALWGALQDGPPEPTTRWGRMKGSLVDAVVQPSLWLPAGDLDDARLDDYADRLEAFRPQVLEAYPSAADLLARRLLARGRRLGVPLVVLTAETTFPDQRERIAGALGAEVVTFYGAREIGWIALECREARALHVNTAGVHVEAADDGRLLLTDLVNRAMPLIRYEIGDRGRLADAPCPCGDPRPVIAELHGRVQDVFRLPSGRRVPGVLCDVRNYQLGDGIVESQLVQEVPDRLRVRWVAAPTFRPQHLDRFRAFLDGHFRGELAYDLERVERIEPEPNGKVRTCICLLEPEA